MKKATKPNKVNTWPVTNERHLCYLLGISNQYLKQIEASAASYYKPYIKREKKSDGSIKEREICPSTGDLKTIQKRIEKEILRTIPLPDYIYGGRKGKSNVSNAKEHTGKKHKFSLDIKNFFPSVSCARVNNCLLKFGFHPNIASRLTRLMTHEGHVPQGAPTSTAITNLVFFVEVDQKIIEILSAGKITYTRFVDDLNMSSQEDFQKLAPEIARTIIGNGYKISKKKTFYKRGNVEMTGANVGNNGLSKTKKHAKKLADPNLPEKTRFHLQKYVDRLK